MSWTWPDEDDCADYEAKISQGEWEKLCFLIDEFDFWEEDAFREKSGTLDGFIYVVVAQEVEEQVRNRKVVRHSPEYDKIGALCEYMLDLESRIKIY